MIVLSWDVGINNLSFCLIKQYNDKSFKIKSWGLINLETKIKCFKCSKEAKKRFIYNNSIIDTCLNHLKLLKDPLKILKKYDICYKCNKKTNIKINYLNKYSCKECYENYIKIKTLVKIKLNLKDMYIKIFKKLTKLFTSILEKKLIDEVIIENQPSLKNPKMKTISLAIFSFFIINGINKNNIKDVKFISPGEKMKICKENKDIIKKSKNKYKKTKDLSINMCYKLIDSGMKKFFDTRKKKDDLADSFLQGFRYIYKDDVPNFYLKLL